MPNQTARPNPYQHLPQQRMPVPGIPSAIPTTPVPYRPPSAIPTARPSTTPRNGVVAPPPPPPPPPPAPRAPGAGVPVTSATLVKPQQRQPMQIPPRVNGTYATTPQTRIPVVSPQALGNMMYGLPGALPSPVTPTAPLAVVQQRKAVQFQPYQMNPAVTAAAAAAYAARPAGVMPQQQQQHMVRRVTPLPQPQLTATAAAMHRAPGMLSHLCCVKLLELLVRSARCKSKRYYR